MEARFLLFLVKLEFVSDLVLFSSKLPFQRFNEPFIQFTLLFSFLEGFHGFSKFFILKCHDGLLKRKTEKCMQLQIRKLGTKMEFICNVCICVYIQNKTTVDILCMYVLQGIDLSYHK